jgi:hypothetical protein
MTAPHSNDTTSKEAAFAIEPHLSRLERWVYEAIIDPVNPLGLTALGVRRRTGLSIQTVTARIRALVLKGMVKDSGGVGRSEYGRKMIMWVRGDGVRSLSQSHTHYDRGMRAERTRIRAALALLHVRGIITEDAWTHMRPVLYVEMETYNRISHETGKVVGQ